MKICSLCFQNHGKVTDISQDIIPPVEINVDHCPDCKGEVEQLIQLIEQATIVLGVKETTARLMKVLSETPQ